MKFTLSTALLLTTLMKPSSAFLEGLLNSLEGGGEETPINYCDGSSCVDSFSAMQEAVNQAPDASSATPCTTTICTGGFAFTAPIDIQNKNMAIGCDSVLCTLDGSSTTGFFNVDNSKVTMNDLDFKNSNGADFDSPAILVVGDNAEYTATDCIFDNNRCGVQVRTSSNQGAATASFEGCDFLNNGPESGLWVVEMTGGDTPPTVNVDDCVFTSNSGGSTFGGGVNVATFSTSSTTVMASRFSDNSPRNIDGGKPAVNCNFASPNANQFSNGSNAPSNLCTS